MTPNTIHRPATLRVRPETLGLFGGRRHARTFCAGLLIALLAIASTTHAAHAAPQQERRAQIQERLSALLKQIDEKRQAGYDVSDAESLLPSLRQAIKEHNLRRAQDIGTQIHDALDNAQLAESADSTGLAHKAQGLGWAPLPAGEVTQRWQPDVPPFGISGPYVDVDLPSVSRYLRKSGAGWARLGSPASGAMQWNMIEPKPGTWHWSHPDSMIARVEMDGLRPLVNIHPISEWEAQRCGWTPKAYRKLPCDLGPYQEFVRRTAEHYKGRIHYWQVLNEPENPRFWHDTPENYARLVAATAPVLKDVDPTCTVLLAGIDNRAFLKRVLNELVRISPNKRLVDAGDFHVFGVARPSAGRRAHNTYRRASELWSMYEELTAGTPYAGMPMWVTETSTYDGSPYWTFPQQSEQDQARDLVKRMTFPLALGARIVVWNSMIEWTSYSDAGSYYKNVGLVRNPANKRGSGPKLSYYTYQRLTSTLRGLTGARRLETPEWITAISFVTLHGPVVVAWYDRWATGAPRTVTLRVPLTASRATVVRAVPAVTKKGAAPVFTTRTTGVTRGEVSVTLDDDPVYILPYVAK
jgi:hypothetical protein